MALGSWSVQLAPETPQTIIDKIQYLGHVAVSTGRPDPRVSGDSLLTSARYVGVLRGIAWQQAGPQISGSGMAYWLGDENDKGPIITDQLLFTDVDLATAIDGCMAATESVKVGTIHSVSLGYTGYHQFVTIRKAIDFITSTVTDDILNPVEWRVNGDGTLDAGRANDLYGADPTAAVVRRHVGADMALRALPGQAQVTEDVQDYATEVILLGQGTGSAISSAVATLPDGSIPYRDLFGNTVSIKRTVSQSSTNQANSLIQAQIALNQYVAPRDAVQLSADQFDIEGDVTVGSWVWVHDPDSSLVDDSGSPNEIVFRGERINPVKLRVTDMTWPLTQGMSVAYRGPDGSWLDLTDYVVWETGAATLTVGGYNRSLTNPTGVSETLGSRAAPNTTIPNPPTFTTPFVQAIYQSNATGISKAQVQVAWDVPTNTDGTNINDGDHYEIRYRTAATPSDPVTWAQAAGKTWAQLGTWAQPIAYTPGPWTSVYAPFDTVSLLVQELTPAVAYDFQIRAVDNGTPPNYSAWSATATVTTNGDTVPPPPPAPPQVASSLIAVQVTHLLGQAAGGTFNLPADLHHLEVHAQYEPTFTPSAATLLGKLPATNGMMLSQTPVVGTFSVQSTANIYVKVVAVDESGNASNPSSPVQSTAALIDDEHISNLTVSKLLAGTVTTDWLVGANIQTAPSGVRVGMNAGGLFAYTALNAKSWEVQASSGDMVSYTPSGKATLRLQASTGNVYLYGADGTTPMLSLTASTGLVDMKGKLTSGVGVGAGKTIVVDPSTPELSMYPESTTQRIRQRADFFAAPDGSGTAPIYVREMLDVNDDTSGPSVREWPDGSWHSFLDTGGVFGGGTLKLYGPNSPDKAAFLTYINGASEYFVRVDSLGGIYFNAATGQSIEGSVPFGSRANGFYFTAQNGYAPNAGYRWYVDSGANTLRVVDNQANAFIGDGAGGLKTFVIDHPTDPSRWLVHGCIEAPEAQVEYRGVAELVNGRADVELPAYFTAATVPDSATVHLTMLLPDEPLERRTPPPPLPADQVFLRRQPPPHVEPERLLLHPVAASQPREDRFRISSPAPDGTRVAWLVKATRADLPVLDAEPLRTQVQVAGTGPYRYIVPAVTGAAA